MGLSEFRLEIQFVIVVLWIYSESVEDVSVSLSSFEASVEYLCITEVYRFTYSAHLHFDCKMFNHISCGGKHLLSSYLILLFAFGACRPSFEYLLPFHIVLMEA